MLMLTDAHALISDLPGGAAPAAARQATAVLAGATANTPSPAWPRLEETVNWLASVRHGALAHIPGD